MTPPCHRFLLAIHLCAIPFFVVCLCDYCTIIHGRFFWFLYLDLEYSKTRRVLSKLIVSASIFDKVLAVHITDFVLRIDASHNR